MRRVVRMFPAFAIVFAAAASAAGQLPPPPPPGGYGEIFPGARQGKPVSATFQNTPIHDALFQIAKDGEVGVVIAGSVPETTTVTAIIKDAAALDAIDLIAAGAGLSTRRTGNTVMVEAALQAYAPLPPPSPAATYPAPATASAQWGMLGPMQLALVDLDTKDATIAEVMAKLGKQIAPYGDFKIVVHEAVPKDIKVTATVYKMPFPDVFGLILEQAGLASAVAPRDVEDEDNPMAMAYTIFVVPQPKIEVTGVPSRPYGGYGGYGSYGPPPANPRRK